MSQRIVYLLAAALALIPRVVSADEYGNALFPLIEGEFALQEGALSEAADAYFRAAASSSDVALAERAVQVALLAESSSLARRGVQRFSVLTGNRQDVAAYELRIALLDKDVEGALSHIRVVMEGKNGWRLVAAALASVPQTHRNVSKTVLAKTLEDGVLPQKIEGWLTLGGVALRLEDRALYSHLAQAAAVRFPQEARALLWVAEDALSREDDVAARKAIDAALLLPDLTNSERLNIAAHLNELGDAAAAAASLEILADDDRALAARAAYLVQANDTKSLRALYSKLVVATPPNGAASVRLMLLGQLAEMQEDARSAMSWYRQIKGGVQQDQAKIRIAILQDQLGERDNAIASLREIQTSDSEWVDIVRDAYLVEAELVRSSGDAMAEIAVLDRGLMVFEDDSSLRYGRALAYERVDRVDEAIADLRSLVSLNPEEADFLNALGYTLVDRTERLEEGLFYINKALALKPDSPAILDSLGWALHRLGRNEEALPHLWRAFELQRDAEIAAHLATVLAVLGSKAEARSILLLGQELDDTNRALKQAEKVIGP